MMVYPTEIQALIKCFEKLPGLGQKSAERIAFYLLSSPDFSADLESNLSLLRKSVSVCEICGNLSIGSPCHICKNHDRNTAQLCVVQDILDLYAVEEKKIYHGLYHVLNGIISPLNGIQPNDLRIPELIQRIENTEINEIILALPDSIEGDATCQYISEKVSLIQKKDLIVTMLGRGISSPSNLQFIDSKSLRNAFVNRKSL